MPTPNVREPYSGRAVLLIADASAFHNRLPYLLFRSRVHINTVVSYFYAIILDFFVSILIHADIFSHRRIIFDMARYFDGYFAGFDYAITRH